MKLIGMKPISTVKITRPNYTRRTVENGVTYDRDGTEHAQISIYLDADKLASAIGWKAARAKSKRTTLQEGAVIVECDWSTIVR